MWCRFYRVGPCFPSLRTSFIRFYLVIPSNWFFFQVLSSVDEFFLRFSTRRSFKAQVLPSFSAFPITSSGFQFNHETLKSTINQGDLVKTRQKATSNVTRALPCSSILFSGFIEFRFDFYCAPVGVQSFTELHRVSLNFYGHWAECQRIPTRSHRISIHWQHPKFPLDNQ